MRFLGTALKSLTLLAFHLFLFQDLWNQFGAASGHHRPGSAAGAFKPQAGTGCVVQNLCLSTISCLEKKSCLYLVRNCFLRISHEKELWDLQVNTAQLQGGLCSKPPQKKARRISRQCTRALRIGTGTLYGKGLPWAWSLWSLTGSRPRVTAKLDWHAVFAKLLGIQCMAAQLTPEVKKKKDDTTWFWYNSADFCKSEHSIFHQSQGTALGLGDRMNVQWSASPKYQVHKSPLKDHQNQQLQGSRC